MDDDALRQIIREEIAKALEGHTPVTNYHLNMQTGPQPILWPLMALAHKWRFIYSSQKDDPAKSAKVSAYLEAAKDLEEWIKAGSLRLDP